jgi:D-3-phosphoglycerate dehydrogenase
MTVRNCNTLVIGDLYTPCETMRAAVARLQPSRVTAIEWKAKDIAELQARLLQVEMAGPSSVAPPEEIWAQLAGVEFLMTHLCPISRPVVEAAPNLRYLAVCRGEADTIDQTVVKERDIELFTAPGRNANAVAEMTVALMLAEARNIGRAHAAMASGRWRKTYANDDKPGELRGKTAGLIGLGNVGRKVAALLRGFGMKLLVYDPFLSRETIAAAGAEPTAFVDLLLRADFISLHARRGPSDPPLIGAAELQHLKPTAYLVNTARACLLDADALVQALRAGQIAGAALDVFHQEPLPSDSPLRGLDNITLTPHLAGSTPEAWHNAPHMIVEAILEMS